MKPILLIEDDDNDVLLLQHAMTKAGVVQPLRAVSDGVQAMDYLKGAGKFANRADFPLPSMVLLDLKLPRVMGLEVLRWIRGQSGLPMVVIVLTASGQSADVAAAYHLGANAYLIKPGDAREFESMVKALKDFWLVHNTAPPES